MINLPDYKNPLYRHRRNQAVCSEILMARDMIFPDRI